MQPVVTPYDNKSSKKEQVKAMFNNIAHRYDLLNSLLSMGIHKGWRRKAIRLLGNKPGMNMLDVATGTADFALEAMKLSPVKVTGVDISQGMLDLGKEKVKKNGMTGKVELLLADSEDLPFESNTFDAITIGFGVRNFEDLEKGLAEMCRVMKPGGTIAILEFSKPRTFPIKQFYGFYFRRICPFIGRLFAKDPSAYTYLPESVNAFPDGQDFLAIMEKTGFSKTKAHTLTFGIASIYTGTK